VCPIPFFDSNKKLHRQIVEVAREARQKMLKWRSKIGGWSRSVRRSRPE
jgi:hypothetical protein